MHATATARLSGPLTTLHQRQLMSHALGLSASHGQCPTRNAYCVEDGSPDAHEVARLAGMGLMFRGRTINDGRDWYGHVTEAGARELGVELRRED